MHIVQIIDSLRMGGAERWIQMFCKEAKSRTKQISVINLLQEEKTPIGAELDEMGVSVTAFPASRTLSVGRILGIARFLRDVKADLVQTHLTNSNIVGVLAARISWIPVIATLHNTEPDDRNRIILFLEKRVLAHFASGVVAVGRTVEQVYREKLGKNRPVVIMNPVPPGTFVDEDSSENSRKEILVDPSKVVLISVGRLRPQKAPADLILAFSVVHRVFPSTILLIAGDGVLYSEVERLVNELGLNDSVKLLGRRTDIKALLAASDLYVSASHWEGLPLAVLEAMASGLPVVATSVGDIPSILKGRGILVPPKAPAQLASAIVSLLRDPETMRRLGDSARKYVRTTHSVSYWIDQLFELYDKTISRPYLEEGVKSKRFA